MPCSYHECQSEVEEPHTQAREGQEEGAGKEYRGVEERLPPTCNYKGESGLVYTPPIICGLNIFIGPNAILWSSTEYINVFLLVLKHCLICHYAMVTMVIMVTMFTNTMVTMVIMVTYFLLTMVTRVTMITMVTLITMVIMVTYLILTMVTMVTMQ